MKKIAQKMYSNSKAIVSVACVGIIVILFMAVFQQSQEINNITAERDQLKQDLNEKAIEIALYDEKFADYKRELILSLEKDSAQEAEGGVAEEDYQNLDAYFNGIIFEDGLDATELYQYNKQKSIVDYTNMLKMFTEQLELDNQLLELLEHAQAIAKPNSSEYVSIEGYITELVDQIDRLTEFKAQCEKNLAELADYENVCPQP